MTKNHECEECGGPVEYCGRGRPPLLCNDCRGIVLVETKPSIPAGETYLCCPRCGSKDAKVFWQRSKLTTTVTLEGACPDCGLMMSKREIPVPRRMHILASASRVGLS